MNIIKQQLQVSLTKTEVNTLMQKALTDEATSAGMKRLLAPLLADAFPQFPTFSNITIENVKEDGSAVVALREPRETTVKVIKDDSTITEDVNSESKDNTKT